MTKDERIAELEMEVERLKRIREVFRYTLKLSEEMQNQKAIECLKEVLEHFTDRPTFYDCARQIIWLSDTDKKFIDYVNSKIKELEGE